MVRSGHGNIYFYIFSPGRNRSNPSSASVDYIWAYQGQVAFFRSGDKVGLIHKDGRILAEAVYDDVRPFYNGYARVIQNGLWGMIDLTGKVITRPQWDIVSWADEGLIAVKKSKWELLIKMVRL